MAYIPGSPGNDELEGDYNPDQIYGFGGNDTLYDDWENNSVADLLDGGEGNDLIESYGGADWIDGGGGFDRAYITFATSTTVMNFQPTSSDVSASLGPAGGSVWHVEQFEIYGSSGADTICGLDQNDFLDGLNGNDLLRGGGGNDTLTDANFPSNVTTDNDTLDGGDGDDLLVSGFGADSMVGGAGNDSLTGGDTDDTLDGGTGTDSMVGGTGADLYYVDSSLDRVVELAGGGIDRVVSTVSLNLYAEVENLILGGSLAINANGNGLANAMTGNTAANRLNGSLGNDTLAGLGGIDTLDGGGGNDRLDGGTDADSMAGGVGNDTYVVDNAGDVVTEVVGAGIDNVLASVGHTLAENVEKLTLTGTALVGTGNALNNTLTGNGFANTLSGLLGNDSLVGFGGNDTLDGGGGTDTLDGGLGTDSMIGGLGNDVFLVNSAADRVVELAGGGIDRVISTTSLNLAADVENLTLTGTAALNANGNVLGNAMTGNAAANLLNGANGNDSLVGGAGNDTLVGGYGIDTLVGGDGADHFRFGTPNLGYDRIADFTSGAPEVDDVIEVSRAGFGNLLALGALDPTQLSTNTASGAGAQFVYVAATGALRWDADGAGGTAAVTIAVLAGAPTLSAADIVVIA